MSKLKVLFVCMGNICRSPLAEAIFLDYITSNNFQHKFEVDSAGTAPFHVGSKPDQRSIIAARKHSINLNHVARQLTLSDLNYYDFVLVMDHRNYEDVLSLIANESVKSQILLLRSFDPQIGSNMEYTVADPYYGQQSDFDEVYNICASSIRGFANYLLSQNLI